MFIAKISILLLLHDNAVYAWNSHTTQCYRFTYVNSYINKVST